MSAGTRRLHAQRHAWLAMLFVASACAPRGGGDSTVATVPSRKLALGAAHSCVTNSAGNPLCWGLGFETTALVLNPSPTELLSLGAGTRALAIGNQHACGITAAGGVRCVGLNAGNGVVSPDGIDVPGLQDTRAIAAGGNHTCAVIGDGAVSCWGRNGTGELGDGSTTNSPDPVVVAGLPPVEKIAAGGQETCAITTGGEVYCWGLTVKDGVPSQFASSTPLRIAGVANAGEIAVGGQEGADFACASSGGSVLCWGANANGELGIARTTVDAEIVPGLTSVVALAAGTTHACALHSSGTLSCWGDNSRGQLGRSGSTNEPGTVSGLSGVTDVAAGFQASCAASPGNLYCWGDNTLGQVGVGTTGGQFSSPQSISTVPQ